VSGDATATQPALAAGVLPRSFADSPEGVIGGAQVGINSQFGRWVLGVEADFQGTDISDSESVSTAVSGFFPFVTKGSQTLDWLGTARARAGYAVIDPLLLYVTGGLAYGHVEISTSSVNPGCTGICTAGSKSATNAGWTIGAGVEYALMGHWSVKGEYLYYDLGSLSRSLGDTNGRFPTTFQTYSADFKGSIVRVGVNYRFGGP
jgi:outer membrane immunogenic protein